MNNIKNNIPCEIVQDILPLYHDGICSEKSRLLVETHLKNCSVCNEMLKSLDENTVEKELTFETHEVIKRHAKKEKNIAMKTGIIIAGILMIPIIIAIILTLPGYSDWKTNMVLISSMLLVASLTVVPLISKKKKFSNTIIFSTIALLTIIFFVEMLSYNGGILKFCEIAFSVVFGISIVFFPFIVKEADLIDTLKNHKGLLIITWDTLWFYLMIFTFVIAYPSSIKDLLLISTFFVVLIWIIFLISRYLKLNWFIKSAIILALLGICASIGNYMGFITITGTHYKVLDLHLEILITSLIPSFLLLVIGLISERKK